MGKKNSLYFFCLIFFSFMLCGCFSTTTSESLKCPRVPRNSVLTSDAEGSSLCAWECKEGYHVEIVKDRQVCLSNVKSCKADIPHSVEVQATWLASEGGDDDDDGDGE